jgi:hypothetical protein
LADALAMAEDIAETRAALLSELRRATKDPGLSLDEDGDVKMRFGSAVVFVRVLENPALVRVYSPVLAGVTGDDALLRQLNTLNGQLHLARLIFVQGTVFGVVDLPAAPVLSEHVVRACGVLGQLADDIDDLLQAEFGGRTAFGGYRTRSLKN